MRSAFRALYANELRMLLRDTRTLLIAVGAPILLFPLVVLLLSAVENREAERLDTATYRWVLAGEATDWGRPLVDEAIARTRADTTVRVDFEEVALDGADPDSLVRSGAVALAVELVPAHPDSTPRIPAVRLLYRAPSDFSRRAANTLRDRLHELRDAARDSVYRAAGFPVARDQVARVASSNVASVAREAGAFLGLALTPFLVLLMLSGGSIVAADAISGEKERGTLETLLTSAADRDEIVRAKLAAVVTVGIVVAGVNLANLIVYATLGLFDLPTQLAVDLSLPEVALLAALLLPLTLLVGSALLLLSGLAKSYKEYQTWFFPVFLIFLLPSLLPALPDLTLRSPIVAVPIAGLGVAIRDLLVGEADLAFSLLALASTGAAAAGLTRVAERTLSNERLISNAGLDEADLVGGPALFPRHALLWFLGLWVVFFVNALWFGERLGVRGQLVVNLVVIFFGGSLLIARRYRLPLVETFRLRAPRPAALLGAIVGAPSALVLGLWLSETVVQFLFPMPEAMLEAMAEGMGLDLPLGQLLLFVAVMPALFEEFAFRGLLLRGLRGLRMPTWAVVVLGGTIFGLFHVSLFRIPPTAWLGMNLVVVVVLTGSLWPAVLWHFLNNALVIVPTSLGWIEAEGATLPGWSPLAALGGLAVAYGLLWTSREGPLSRAERSPRT